MSGAVTSVLEELKRVYEGLDREPVSVESIDPMQYYPQDTKKAYHSIFNTVFKTSGAPPNAQEAAAHHETSRRCWKLMEDAAKESPGCSAAIASLVGLAIGDAVGHPLEFVPVDSSLPDRNGYNPRRSYLHPTPSAHGDRKVIAYTHPLNKFQLKPGQWTDDASMSLCLADSLLVHKGYHGGDARIRWHMWWNHGYNNAFRFEPPYEHGCPRGSVGLGGNIAMSIAEIDEYPGATPNKVPSIYGSVNEDAGNGSIMRLAPVPIAYFRDIEAGEAVAERQSRGTHPGPDAVACCRFMTYFISSTIKAHDDGRKMGDVKEYLKESINAFLERTKDETKDSGMAKLHDLLQSNPPSERECNWEWMEPELKIRAAIVNRRRSEDGRYNGYPVIPTYWGAYCMDGLSMALWSMYHSTSFSDCVVRVVNLLGDADTTGAIAAQMAGAFYGLDNIKNDEMGKVFLRDLKVWDPYCEIGLRAALLYHFEPETKGDQNTYKPPTNTPIYNEVPPKMRR